MSEAVLITRGKVSGPFWKASSKDISKRLWLPTKIGGRDLDLSSSSGYSNLLAQNLKWSSVPISTPKKNSPKTSWKLLPSLRPDTMEKENTKFRTQKLRFYPNREQKLLLKKCFDTGRFVYNNAINVINTRFSTRKKEFEDSLTCVLCKADKEEDSFLCKKHKNRKLPWKLNIKLESVRPDAMKNDEDLSDDEQWQKEVPYDTRQLMVKEAVSMYKSAVTNKLRGNIQHFQLGFKSRKNSRQICCINKNAIKKGFRLFVSRLKNKSKLRFRTKVKRKLSTIDHDCKILKDGKAYYLLLIHDMEVNPVKHPHDYVAMDPGVRTFQTCYSPSGIILESGDPSRVRSIASRIDLLQSLRTKIKSKRITHRIHSLNKKIRDVVTNMHYQTAAVLTDNFKNILLPTFCTSKMKTGGLASKTKRTMDYFGFYQFKQKLRLMCYKKDCNLYIVDEAYTTMTCTCCGELNTIGSNKVYTCKSCNFIGPRDICGARNILLKHLELA